LRNNLASPKILAIYACGIIETEKIISRKKRPMANENVISGAQNIIRESLVDPTKILILPLHIKFDLMK